MVLSVRPGSADAGSLVQWWCECLCMFGLVCFVAVEQVYNMQAFQDKCVSARLPQLHCPSSHGSRFSHQASQRPAADVQLGHSQVCLLSRRLSCVHPCPNPNLCMLQPRLDQVRVEVAHRRARQPLHEAQLQQRRRHVLRGRPAVAQHCASPRLLGAGRRVRSCGAHARWGPGRARCRAGLRGRGTIQDCASPSLPGAARRVRSCESACALEPGRAGRAPGRFGARR